MTTCNGTNSTILVLSGTRLSSLPPDEAVLTGQDGSKHHLITDATGIPPAAILTGGNRNDVTHLIPLLQAVPPVRGKRPRPGAARTWCWATTATTTTGIAAGPESRREAADRPPRHRARLRTRHPTLGRGARVRHLHSFRRLRVRRQIGDAVHEAFLTLGCALICWRRLKSSR